MGERGRYALKRIMLCALALLLALSAFAASAEAAPERVLYADQGGVRVFAEDGRAGLMDSAGNVLLPAEYDGIEPFGEGGCAVLHRLEASGRETKGVVRRDGTVAVPCEWQVVEICPGVGLAECWNDFGDQHIYDLATGEEWKTLGPNVSFDADEKYIYLLTYGSADFGFNPPFHTDVYGADRQPLFSVDAWFVRGFGPDYAILQYDDGTWGVMDASGRTVVDGLCEPPVMDGHSWAYEEPRTGDICCVRRVKNLLSGLLKPFKLDRRHMAWYLSLLGVDPKGDLAEALLSVYDDGRMCGVVDPDGNARFEIPGVAVYGPDDAGLYRVKICGYDNITQSTDLWCYVDAAGETVLGPKYSDAYAFVDGTAVVQEGGRWRLIDAAGDPVGALDWAWGPDVWSLDALELPVIPIQEGDGYRIIDRRGNYVTDEVFRSAGTTFGGRLMLTDRDGSLCLMDGAGNITLRAPAEEWSFYDGDAEAVWILRDGLWGRMAAAGARAGEWLIPPAYAGQERLDDGGFYLTKPDGTAVYAGRDGAELGPAPVYADDGW